MLCVRFGGRRASSCAWPQGEQDSLPASYPGQPNGASPTCSERPNGTRVCGYLWLLHSGPVGCMFRIKRHRTDTDGINAPAAPHTHSDVYTERYTHTRPQLHTHMHRGLESQASVQRRRRAVRRQSHRGGEGGQSEGSHTGGRGAGYSNWGAAAATRDRGRTCSGKYIFCLPYNRSLTRPSAPSASSARATSVFPTILCRLRKMSPGDDPT